MALTAALTYKGIMLADAYIRLLRLHGSKDGGWYGFWQIYASESACYPDGRDAPRSEPLAEVDLRVDYADADPRPMLWRALPAVLTERYGAEKITPIFERGQDSAVVSERGQ